MILYTLACVNAGDSKRLELRHASPLAAKMLRENIGSSFSSN